MFFKTYTNILSFSGSVFLKFLLACIAVKDNESAIKLILILFLKFINILR